MVERYSPTFTRGPAGPDEWHGMQPSELGGYILASDYDALSRKCEGLERDAARWRAVRIADADNDEPYVARHRVDSWGNSKTEWLMHNDADAAIDAHLSQGGVGEEK
jgi:hypothetical protein